MGFPFLSVLLIVTTTPGNIAQSGASKTVFRRSEIKHLVTDAENVTSTRDDIDCARHCRKFSHCMSWAFDAQSSTCYLHPTVGPDPGNGTGVSVYTDTAPMCLQPPAPNVAVLTRTRTLTSQEGTCTDDYMAESTPVARCLATGQWEVTGQCKQQIYRNFNSTPGYEYIPPITPSVGYSVCLKATPTGGTRFIVNLITQADLIAFVFDARGFQRTIVLSSNIGGWTTNDLYLSEPNITFPFAVGQQFDLKMTAVSAKQWEVYLGGRLFETSKELLSSVTSIRGVNLDGEPLIVDTLDIYCG